MYVTGLMAVVCWEKNTHKKRKTTGCNSLLGLVQSEQWLGLKKKKKTKSFVADTGSSLGHSRDKKDGGSQKQKLEPASLNETIN